MKKETKQHIKEEFWFMFIFACGVLYVLVISAIGIIGKMILVALGWIKGGE